ncbi:hypothetical protein IMZ48_02090 [Candidatus Bathyarchaeota archaeon]|nr:hypothetical protein [Candidatus Bathyarchaeota archaeon]
MSILFKTTTVVISPIVEGEDGFRGFRFVANGNELELADIQVEDVRVRRFIHMSSELE